MKRLLLAASVLGVALLATGLLLPRRSFARTIAAVEYKVVSVNIENAADVRAGLDQAGQDGWRLVTITVGSPSGLARMFFTR